MDSLNVVTSEQMRGRVVCTPAEGHVNAQFGYDVRDPYAVSLIMITPGSRPVTWTFARELLEGGLQGGFGSGAVIVAPSPDGQKVLIGLGEASDLAVIHLEPAPIRRFLDKTYRAVRPGRECEYVNVDEVVAQLLAI
jgi:hypothetical protein